MGAFGAGERKVKGDCFIEFAKEHKLIIAKMLFQKPKITDTGLGSHLMEKQETDFALSSQEEQWQTAKWSQRLT